MRILHRLNQLWLQYEYKHTTLAIAAIILFVVLVDTAIVSGALHFIEKLGYVGAFIAGMLSVSFFTAVPALVILVTIAQDHDIFALAIVAGAGGMIGDWLLLLFFEEKVFQELRPLLQKLRIRQTIAWLRRPRWRWLLLAGGALVISTPLPDEIGIALLVLTPNKTPEWQVAFRSACITLGRRLPRGQQRLI